MRDNTSGRISSLVAGLQPSFFPSGRVANSSLILATAAEPQAGQEDSTFIIGGDKVLPNPAQVFSRQEKLRAYVQIYNLAVDPATHKASVSAEYEVSREGKPLIEEAGDPAQLARATIQVTLDKKISLQSLPPGQYALQIKVTDNIRGQTITPSTIFLVQ
jgi:hypothetical protein